MSTAEPQPWRTRLIGLTALAVAILLLQAGRAASARAAADDRRAAMVADLRRLASALDAAFARDGQYPVAIGGGDSAFAFTPSPGVVLHYDRWSVEGWSATVEDARLTVTPTRCGIWVGDAAAAPHRATLHSGVPACW